MGGSLPPRSKAKAKHPPCLWWVFIKGGGFGVAVSLPVYRSLVSGAVSNLGVYHKKHRSKAGFS